MITEQIHNSLKHAAQDLILAETELNRPHEDVVTLSACQSVRTSMKKMMHLYLTANDINNHDKMSIEELMTACISANESFSGVDISNIECKGMAHEKCEGKYCLSIENVSCCLAAAKELKDIVWFELKVK